MSTTTTLLTLPFLALISIPLVITAAITIFFSAVALSLQLTVISIELCYALLTNLFTIPPSSNWSLLSFSVSGPNTPDRRRSSDYGHGILHTPLPFRSQGRPSLGLRMGSSNPLLDTQNNQDSPLYTLENRYTRRPSTHRNHSYTNPPGLQGLISGDEYRDFEGLGGWRCPPSYTKSPGYRSGRTTPSSANSVSDEMDDIAWVSMNSRLELPSQPLMLRHSTSSSHNLLHGGTSAEPYLPGARRNSRVGISGSTDTKRSSKGQHHHRRSATTSAVSVGTLSPTSQVRFSRDPRHGWNALQSKGDALRSKSHTSLSEQWGHNANPMTNSVSSGGVDYFALQPMSSGSNGAKTTSNTTPKEERKPARVTIQLGETGVGEAHQIPSLWER
ncbi:hypothetical protein ASPSYDRAFT_923860 [Aspergillus sydowii CBS 593.65]|uniref:Uncharacterized protein n=1 Tax=Aspergillus sydowii CBS 593.65 TaxID=1036612 RepID=A0A1L9TL51_9EURO|nr:uncharacterized protein ASPSYDRAFT_923860 [Aspergillus sydowii CBS 593.65]OJJ60145.1 hypothetical protein ASPSYDRAFT_923860 [Aspergillus sydowii CBS 593.65]